MNRQTIRNRIIGNDNVDPADLLANPNNHRVHPREQMDALNGALREVGWVQQVMVNQRTGHLIDGHARVKLALENDEPEIPVVYVDLSENEEAAILASFDALTAMAGQDDEALAALLADVAVEDDAFAQLLASLNPGDGEFDPGDADDQGKLDELEPQLVTCPHCGGEFDTRGK